ncbi:XRE family transcriptional regulator [Paractinoplanes hotanensis]|uniref:XRE family transcriptional regulator n=1 Tax=Paractinoplanes hotanensis TaxID=2906497 RepID=A0ABT0Y854_9ACTN|nr:XRE family transcriptional regulator [Actinoplanes hotanensis]MCM4082231.1 XRE family transcriptional regulator [Actinoplanes hotanensis]
MAPKNPNNLLRAYRERLFGTQAAMADAANEHLAPTYLLTANHIGKLERGVVDRPSAPRRAALRTICGVQTDAEIGFERHKRRGGVPLSARFPATEARPSAGPGAVVAVSTDVAIPVVTDASTPAGWRIVGYLAVRDEAQPPAELSIVAANATRQALPETIIPPALPPVPDLGDYPGGEWNSFLTVTRLLASQRQAVAPAALLSLVEAHRDCLAMLFRQAEHDPLRSRIGAMVAEASIVASRLWSAQGNRPMALAHCTRARQLGDDLGNRALAATARIFESNLRSDAATLIGRSGDIADGLRLLQEAQALSADLGPTAQARLAAEQAQIFAVLKLPSECDAALERARAASASIAERDRSGLFSDWNASRLGVYEGTCRLFLGEPKKAAHLLEAAVAQFASDSSNVSVGLAAQVDLASAYAQTDDLDKSCALLGDAYGELVAIGNRRGVDRAERARERLSPWNSERLVRELDERMAACRAA